MLDRDALARAVAAHGAVARVVVTGHRGSAPREAGAAMLVWATGQSGTIGGGALEWQAAAQARACLASGPSRVDRIALGPDMGQCCGGAVTLVTEVFTPAALPPADAPAFARPIAASATPDMPLALRRALARARDRGETPPTLLSDGWLIEPMARAQRPVWIWGAGHVGRALIATLAPLPDLSLTWADTAPTRFPDDPPAGVATIWAEDPVQLLAGAPSQADHLILTYSHALDLALCHALLTHGFASAGLIGSATKWARFRSRLAALGHSPAAIARIACPIGDPALGKHPQAIAIGVAATLLRAPSLRQSRQDQTG